MFQLDLKSRKSIYEQVTDNLKELIMTGILASGEKLPSVRELSKTITVNPNTVQRAFEQLEQQGVLYSQRGAGWFVSENTEAARDLYESLVREKVAAFFDEMTGLGKSADEIKKIVEEWEV